MTRNWVRVTNDRLRDVVAIFDRVERSVKRLAEELDCTPANARNLLRRAEAAGLIGPDWRARKAAAPAAGNRLPDSVPGSEDTPKVPAKPLEHWELRKAWANEPKEWPSRRY